MVHLYTLNYNFNQISVQHTSKLAGLYIKKKKKRIKG